MRSVDEWVSEISSQLTMNRRAQWSTVLSSAVEQIRNEQREEFVKLLFKATNIAEMQGHDEAISHLEGVARTVVEDSDITIPEDFDD